jgi:sugar lactone lactonase YvrE
LSHLPKFAAGVCGLLIVFGQRVEAQSPPLVVTTVAGLSEVGSADGAPQVARFHLPTSVAVDAAGNVYVADTDNSTIRKVTPAGMVSTLAGLAEHPGVLDGTNSSARFNQPWGVAVDMSGNVWVADTYNQTIREISPAGMVVTIAGTTNVASFRNGPAVPNSPAGALFNYPDGITVDNAGNVYIADTDNHLIRRITNGLVSTLAGSGTYGNANGTASGASFGYPIAVACDAAGNVFVADYGNGLIRRVTPGRVVTTVGNSFSEPAGIGVDSATNLYVADTGNEVIRKLTVDSTGTNWAPSLFAGNVSYFGDADGIGPGAQFYYPEGIAVDVSNNIYVGDSVNNTIRKITPVARVTTLAGPDGSYGSADGTTAMARFDEPFGVAADSATNLYVADTFNNTIRLITPAGMVSTLAGLAGFSGGADGSNNLCRFDEPTGVCVDGAGNLYVADFENSTVRKITPDAAHSNWVTVTLCGQAGTNGFLNGNGTNALLNHPYALALDAATNLYVTDYGNDAIRMVTPSGAVSTYAGTGIPGFRNGTGTNAAFNYPVGIAVDSATNVYVADSGNDCVRIIAPGGVVSTLIGTADQAGTNDGYQPLLDAPEGVAVNTAGYIFVADTGSDTIREMSPGGYVTTVAGAPGIPALPGSADGLGVTAQFDYPVGLALDPSGALYVADAFNNTIRKATTYQPVLVTLLAALPSAGIYQFTFPTVAGEMYTIQQTANLALGPWTTTSNLTGSGATFQFTTPATNGPQFFRVVQP